MFSPAECSREIDRKCLEFLLNLHAHGPYLINSNMLESFFFKLISSNSSIDALLLSHNSICPFEVFH